MLKLAVGYGKSMIDAKERAIFFYDEVKERKVFKFVESQPGYNEIGDPAWVTTIWFETIDSTPEEKKKEEEKYLFIGSEDIDPNDPNWREKWEAKQLDQETADAEWRLNTDDFDGGIQVGVIPSVDLAINHIGSPEFERLETELLIMDRDS